MNLIPKSAFTALLFLIASQLAFAQKSTVPKETFYQFDKNWKPVADQRAAAYFGRLSQLADSLWQWDVYQFTGPMIGSQQFLDQDLKVMNGRQRYFHSNGNVDSTGKVSHNLAVGEWTFFNDSGVAVMKKVYDRGRLLCSELLKDSTKRDTTDNPDETEAYFEGGIKKWQNYLYKNMKYPDRAQQCKATGMVKVSFVVDTLGRVFDVEIVKSVEYSLDEESMRLIRISPKWVPAVQKGRLVKAYKLQPLLFDLR